MCGDGDVLSSVSTHACHPTTSNLGRACAWRPAGPRRAPCRLSVISPQADFSSRCGARVTESPKSVIISSNQQSTARDVPAAGCSRLSAIHSPSPRGAPRRGSPPRPPTRWRVGSRCPVRAAVVPAREPLQSPTGSAFHLVVPSQMPNRRVDAACHHHHALPARSGPGDAY